MKPSSGAGSFGASTVPGLRQVSPDCAGVDERLHSLAMLTLYHHGSSACAAKVRFRPGGEGPRLATRSSISFAASSSSPGIWRSIRRRSRVARARWLRRTRINRHLRVRRRCVPGAADLSAGCAWPGRSAVMDQGGRRRAASRVFGDHLCRLLIATPSCATGRQLRRVPEERRLRRRRRRAA